MAKRSRDHLLTTPAMIERALASILPTVTKPGRYTGGELNQVVKDWARAPYRVALAFPDLYDLGMSNLGLAILYEILNREPDALAERVFLPWIDMETAMRAAGMPLFSLETKHPIGEFDLLGISLPYESLCTNLLNLLDLSRLPLRAADRGPEHPLVLAGGHATFNPEPVADFVDAFAIGDGEELIADVVGCLRVWKGSGRSRGDLLRELARIESVYVPSLYRVHYHGDGRVAQVVPLAPEAKLPVLKRVVPELPPPVTPFVVPYVDVVQNRAAIEIMRGCTRGCRFCHAGVITRPVRQRSVSEIIAGIDSTLASTGYEEVGLLSLSSSDYDHILDLVHGIDARFGDRHVHVSLPSLRIESFSVDLMELLGRGSRRGGFTLAPEAATERMRRIINKPVSTETVLTTAREIYRRGWRAIKLYFMIGFPTETLEDVREIARLARAVLAEGRKTLGRRAQVNVAVSTFVPKPHTPFQWVPCDTVGSIVEKQALLSRELRGRGLKLSWTDPHETLLEAWLARGDRRLGEVVLAAWRGGAKFDAWPDHFRPDVWRTAFSAAGLDPSFYTHRERSADETLPWDHIDAGVEKAFLREDYAWSLEGRTRVDCREECFVCGILPKFKALRREHPGDAWECPEVGVVSAPNGPDCGASEPEAPTRLTSAS